MAHDTQENLCPDCLSYLLGQMTDIERQAFEQHLLRCEQCQAEIAELQPLVNALPYSAAPVPIPGELKQKTLAAAFHVRAPVQNISEQVSSWRQFLTNRFGKLAVGLVMLLTVALSASLSKIYEEGQLTRENVVSPQPVKGMRIEASFPLHPVNAQSDSSGMAYLAQTSDGIRLIVQIRHAEPLQGEQAYQVWLLKNGQRQNAGTFRVDEKGDGVLVFDPGSSKPEFDNIGITKEPDANGITPRGPKVIGMKL